MLERHVGLDRGRAMAAMLRIHQHGGALLPLPSREAAQAAADAIARDARAQGHRLTCGAVSVD
jgi:ATP-dependent Clp protease adapter protein ClpS